MQDNRTSLFRRTLIGVIIASLGLFSAAANSAPAAKKSTAPAVKTAKKAAPAAVPEPVPAESAAAAGEEEEDPSKLPEMLKTPFPGYYRIMVGSFEVTALFDGTLKFNPELLKNIDKTAVDAALSHHYGQGADIQTAVNAYLIHTGEHLVLVDAGAGKLFSPDGQGKILENLKAAGYKPEQVDVIILTHLHGDHVGGMSDAEGYAVFPNATAYTNRQENEYWLSEQKAAAAPVERQIFFRMAMNATGPYVGAEKWKPIEAGTEIVPGIKLIGAYGHTPGHSGFLISSGGQSLFIWGDIVHSHVMQFRNPGVAIEYDSDTNLAVATRKKVLKMAAEKRQLIAGMHLPFPGIGHVLDEGNGRYSWVPIEYGEYAYKPAPAPAPEPEKPAKAAKPAKAVKK